MTTRVDVAEPEPDRTAALSPSVALPASSDFLAGLNEVASAIGVYVRQHESQAPLGAVEYLRECYAAPQCPPIDYNLMAIPFLEEYFLENFWKYARTFTDERAPYARRIIDAGCGSGAALVAYLAVLNASIGAGRWRVQATLIDKCQVQINLAVDLLGHVASYFKHLDLEIEMLQTDLLDWEPEEGIADVVLFGHVLNENPTDINVLTDKAVKAVAGAGKIFILERSDEVAWPSISETAARTALPVVAGTANLHTDIISSPSPRLARKSEHTTRYLVIDMPEKRQAVALLKRYFQAWEAQSVEMLEDIFITDAIYQEKPFHPAPAGMGKIKQYWREHVLVQANIDTGILRVAYTGLNVFAEWESRFVSKGNKMHLKGVLILTLDRESGKVSALHEYFSTRKEPLKPDCIAVPPPHPVQRPITSRSNRE